MEPGTYTVLFRAERNRTIAFGAAGDRELDRGYHAYTGSAWGPGGLSRVDRHRRLAVGAEDTRHWHVDSLLGGDGITLRAVFTADHVDRECEIAGALDGTPIEGIGATDCDCTAHLVFNSECDPLVTSIQRAYETA